MDNTNNAAGANPGSSNQTVPVKQSGQNILMGILSYLGILIIIPFLVSKDVPFVKFHIKQGLILIVVYAIVWAAEMFLGGLWPIFAVVRLAALVFAIIGIVNVIQGKEKELPIIGQYAKSFNF